MMKKTRLQAMALLMLMLCILFLTACGASAAEQDEEAPETPPQESAAAPETEEPAAERGDATLADLLGEDYVTYLTETITMQMGNRMDKDPEVVYFPIAEGAPLTDYAAIDETTEFQVNADGNLVILFPEGTVTDASHGAQSFIVPLP